MERTRCRRGEMEQGMQEEDPTKSKPRSTVIAIFIFKCDSKRLTA